MKEKKCNICKELKTLDQYYSQQKTKSNGSKYMYYYPYCINCAKDK